MRHKILRRLSALALALVMAVSLCTPAWADEGDDGETERPNPKFNTELIIFKSVTQQTPYDLIVSDVANGDTINWTVSNGAAISPNETETTVVQGSDGTFTGNTVKVSASMVTGNGTVTAQVRHDGNPVGPKLICHVYCETAPFIISPVADTDKNLPNMYAGTSQQFTITFDNNDIDIKPEDVIVTSSNRSAATIETVNPAMSGNTFRTNIVAAAANSVTRPTQTTIRVDFRNGGYFDEWSLTVAPAPAAVPVTSVDLSPSTLDMVVRETHDALTAIVHPDNATYKTVTWYSDNKSVVTVDESSGKITAEGEGWTTIYAMADGVKSNTCFVEVSAAPNSVTLNKTALILDATKPAEASKQLTATAYPASGTAYAWTTSNAFVARLDTTSGRSVTVTGLKEGTAVITVTATFTDANNRKTTKTAQCSVTVIDKDSKPVKEITLSEKSHTMPADGTFNLSVTSFNPSNALNKSITWKSDDDEKKEFVEWEKVNDTTIKITGKKAGTVRFTATADFGGADKICVVTITPIAETITLSGFSYDSNTTGTNKYIYTFRDTANDYFSVLANLGPTGAADPIHWVSANPAVATVSNTTGTRATVAKVAPGRTKITAVPMDPNGKDRVLDSGPAEITVTVSGIVIQNDASNPITSLTLMQGQYRQIQAEALGSANNGDNSVDWVSSDPAVVSVSTKNGATTTLTARSKGSAIITATKGTYTASCTVNVTEDTAGLITTSGNPGVAVQFSTLLSQLQSACSIKTGSSLAYITNLSVSSTEQGILHDNHHSSDDTGAGVGIQDRYYPGTPPQGQRSMNDLSFVPRTTFSGVAEISYTAWSTNNQSVNGVIQVTVNGTGDVMYSGIAGSPVNFQASDFSRIHSNLRSVSFTPPLESAGILYYKYTSPSQPGTRVTASSTYSRTGTPNLDDVTFVPAAGYQGTVRISYKGTDTSGKAISGVVTINVGSGSGTAATPADISYAVRKNDWVEFVDTDFNDASRYALNEPLSYVRFTLPPSSEGTLFYNYRGFGNFDNTVSPTTNYYYSGTPSLANISFVPATTTSGRVDIPYTGYTTKGNTFSGTVHIGLGDGIPDPGGVSYTVYSGRTVSFNAGDFNAVCVAETGKNLASIQFSGLPGTSQGTLRYTWGSSSTSYSVSSGTRFYRTGSSTSNLISKVYFQAANNYVGTLTIPYSGTSENGTTFAGEVTIVVLSPVSDEITYSGTTANPVRFTSSRIVSATSGVLKGTVSYITFSDLPDPSVGKLYLDYNGFGTGTPVTTGTRYYVSGTPSINQISFVPRGRFSGQVGIGYTAVNTSNQSVNGRIILSITSSGRSNYFNDMGNHTWAAPSVDYLYQNGVVKGTTATTFGPNRNIKRCDFVLMLNRAFGFTGSNGYSFADVPTSSYYSQAVATAKNLGIISGDGVYFHPNSNLTRQDAMVMIYNALNAAGWNVSPASASVLNQFSDRGSVSSYAQNAVSALVHMGAVNGSTSGRLNPRSPITRAEAAVILHFIMTE